MEAKKNKNYGLWSAWARIMSEMKPYRFSFGLSVLLSIVSTLLGIISIVLLERFIQD